MLTCQHCNKQLTGKQTKYCCIKCKNHYLNNSIQCYAAQKKRAVERKTELVISLGGKCEICGYNNNLAGLCFHHKDGNDKTLKLDSRHLANNNLERIKKEVKKCQLVCHNCHMELHYKYLCNSIIQFST